MSTTSAHHHHHHHSGALPNKAAVVDIGGHGVTVRGVTVKMVLSHLLSPERSRKLPDGGRITTVQEKKLSTRVKKKKGSVVFRSLI